MWTDRKLLVVCVIVTDSHNTLSYYCYIISCSHVLIKCPPKVMVFVGVPLYYKQYLFCKEWVLLAQQFTKPFHTRLFSLICHKSPRVLKLICAPEWHQETRQRQRHHTHFGWTLLSHRYNHFWKSIQQSVSHFKPQRIPSLSFKSTQTRVHTMA